MRTSFLQVKGGTGLVGCVFCEIVKGSIPSHVLFQDEDFIAILDKYPIALGHTLVMPKKHFERVNDLSIRDFSALYTHVYALNRVIISRMNASASHISINDGAAANQLIPHVHVHIIPRSQNDSAGFTARKLVTTGEMDKICKKLRVSDLKIDA
jgi:histidine triad (HIT) family protein